MKRREFLRTTALAAASGLALSRPSQALAAPNPSSWLEPENPRDPERLAVPGSRSALVVGGGLAGLSAALELAERGFRVTLREAERVLGGRLSTRRMETRAGTFNVEHGLHMWFDNYHVFRDIRRRLGIDHHFRSYNQVHFVFRDYEPEVLESTPPRYPSNLINILRRSPNLNLGSGIRQLGLIPDVMFFNYDGLYDRLDDLSFPEWVRRRAVTNTFYQVLLQPAASVTLNDPEAISAAEMVLYMHYYLIGQPRAMNREITTTDHGTAVIDPWASHLEALGVELQLGRPVPGLRFRGSRATGTTDDPTEFDWVVMASNIPGAQAVLRGSTAADAEAEARLGALTQKIDAMRVAPPYKVLRVWFDRALDASRPDVLETPQHAPINLVAQFHLLEDEAAAWARASGGSVLEFHLYANPMWAHVEDRDVWPRIRSVALELFPELADAEVLAQTVGSHHDFSSFEVGQGRLRPRASTPAELGLTNLALAGDWIHTNYPTALMERAVATGREAANLVLLGSGVRQAAIEVTSKNGPGLF